MISNAIIEKIASGDWPETLNGCSSMTHLPKTRLHNISVVYICSLLEPYVQILGPMDHVNSVLEWLGSILTGDLKDSVFTLVNKMLKEIANTREIYQDSDFVRQIKEYIIQILVAEILELPDTDPSKTDLILPWAIRRRIALDPPLSKMFGISGDRHQLPIHVTVCDSSLERSTRYMVSEEFACGLLLFLTTGAGKFTVRMFNKVVSPEFMLDDNPFIKKDPTIKWGYSIDVAKSTYNFNTLNFLGGFIAVASWSGVDKHKYWGNLRTSDSV